MKVVLFCGGFGTRLREYSDTIPKSMVSIGPRPIIWHLMKYYAHYGHTEFVLCLGYRGGAIKDYFKRAEFASAGWEIDFLETGIESSIGERLAHARGHIGDREVFLASYGDTLTDAPLPRL